MKRLMLIKRQAHATSIVKSFETRSLLRRTSLGDAAAVVVRRRRCHRRMAARVYDAADFTCAARAACASTTSAASTSCKRRCRREKRERATHRRSRNLSAWRRIVRKRFARIRLSEVFLFVARRPQTAAVRSSSARARARARAERRAPKPNDHLHAVAADDLRRCSLTCGRRAHARADSNRGLLSATAVCSGVLRPAACCFCSQFKAAIRQHASQRSFCALEKICSPATLKF